MLKKMYSIIIIFPRMAFFNIILSRMAFFNIANTKNKSTLYFWDNFGLYLTILGAFAVATVVTQ